MCVSFQRTVIFLCDGLTPLAFIDCPVFHEIIYPFSNVFPLYSLLLLKDIFPLQN